jgi:hypothetical protein
MLRSRFLVLAGALTVFALAGCSSDDPTAVVRDSTPPVKPQALYSVTGDGNVTLYWVKNTDADLAGTASTWPRPYAGPYNPLGTTSNTTYNVTGLTNGVTQYFAVAAYDVAATRATSRSRTSTTRRAPRART